MWSSHLEADHCPQLLRSICHFFKNFFFNQDKLVVPKGSQTIFDSVTSTDKEFKTYEGAFHNLYVELPDVRADAIQRTLEFINNRLQ